MKDFLKIIFALVSIIAGIVAIIKILGNAEFVIVFLALSFGVLAMIWTSMARNSLSIGSSLRNYTNYFMACLVFILIYSIWTSASKIFSISGSWDYIGYIFLIITYLIFVSAAYNIYHLGKEFGFQSQADSIRKEIIRKEKKK